MNTSVQTRASSSGAKASLFRTVDGKNHFFTFALVTSLFLLWGFAVPLVCFVFIAIYGVFWQKLENKDREV